MRVLVLGIGKMGRVAAEDLAVAPEVSRVGLVDTSSEVLTKVAAQIGPEKVDTYAMSGEDRTTLTRLMEKYDVVLATLPDRAASYAAWECAIEAGIPLVDILEEYHRRPDTEETENLRLPKGMTLEEFGEHLHTSARNKGLILLDGMGFAPGLSNITLQAGIDRLDHATEAIARVGGVPDERVKGNHPLGYMITWRFDHVLREYMAPARIIEGGRLVEVAALSGGVETFRMEVGGEIKELECAVTPGMPSFPYTRKELHTFAEKTVRWPGHWDGIQTLKDCGMLSLVPVRSVEHDHEVLVTPRSVLATVMEPLLQPREGEGDICVMWNHVTGTRNGSPTTLRYSLWEGSDMERGWSAMARVTAHPAAVATIMVGLGRFDEHGIVAPEECIRGERYREFLDRLTAYDVHIREWEEPAEPGKLKLPIEVAGELPLPS
jgi:lysine 6-dehydrogenase